MQTWDVVVTMVKNKSDKTVVDATYYLHCSHCQGSSRKEYWMKCIILKDMDNERLKVLVFGDRNWRDREHIKHVRYVDKYRVSEMPKKQKGI
jgi:hypothetical protein